MKQEIFMNKEIFINMENEIFTGNVLDIGMDNCGIIYSIFKEFDDDVTLEYLHGKEGRNIQKEFYHKCILFFSLGRLWRKSKKTNLIKDIYGYLREDGLLYIWDIDKGLKKTFNGSVKVAIPGKKIRKLNIKEFNLFKDNSKENILKLLEEWFEVLDFKSSDGIFYIKAKKKLKEEKGNDKKDEGTTNGA